MRLDNRQLDSVRVWSTATPDAVTQRFWNMMLRECYDKRHGWPVFIALGNLWAYPCGPREGRYEHHDGWRCP